MPPRLLDCRAGRERRTRPQPRQPPDFLRTVPGVSEVSISHALMADALELGLHRHRAGLSGIHRFCCLNSVLFSRCEHDLRHRNRSVRCAPHRRRAGPPGRAFCPPRCRADRAHHLAGPPPAVLARPAATRPPGFRPRPSAKPLAWGCACHDTACLRNSQPPPTGQPTIVLIRSKHWFEARGLHAHVTVTDEGDHAASFVVVEQNRPSANPDTKATCMNRHPPRGARHRRHQPHQSRQAAPAPSAHWRPHPVWPQLRESRAAYQAVQKIRKARPDILIAVDHEGGRVQRFKTDGFTHLPPMRALGPTVGAQCRGGRRQRPVHPGQPAMQASMHIHATNVATACGHVLGAELRACGVDLSFTPCSTWITATAASSATAPLPATPAWWPCWPKPDARPAAKAAWPTAANTSRSRLCARGLHLDIPVDDRPLATILADDATPTRLSSSLTSVMPAHRHLQPVDRRPAGFPAAGCRTSCGQQLSSGAGVQR